MIIPQIIWKFPIMQCFWLFLLSVENQYFTTSSEENMLKMIWIPLCDGAPFSENNGLFGSPLLSAAPV